MLIKGRGNFLNNIIGNYLPTGYIQISLKFMVVKKGSGDLHSPMHHI